MYNDFRFSILDPGLFTVKKLLLYKIEIELDGSQASKST